jgi:hypothetical protein
MHTPAVLVFPIYGQGFKLLGRHAALLVFNARLLRARHPLHDANLLFKNGSVRRATHPLIYVPGAPATP